MKIAALRFHNVKRFAGRGVAIENIGDGVNVLCAANEHGKSTSFEALHALFFQPHTGLPRDVKRLQPYSGGNPLVEADIVTAEGRFRLTKQFIGGRRASVVDLATGRLMAQADEAEAFITALISGGSTGPAGLLWVRQGLTGLEERDRKEEEGERRVRESLLTSVQGEVEAMTGGRRMSAILEACASELAQITTNTLRPRAGGPYAAAVHRSAELQQRETALRQDVESLREALDRRGAAQRRLDELARPEEKAARRAALDKAEAASAAAKAHADALRAQEAEAALARTRHDEAARALAEFRDALARSSTLAGEMARAEGRRQETVDRRGAAQQAADAAQGTIGAAEAEERAARERLARAEQARRARQAAEELAALQDREGQAEAGRLAIEQAQAALALMALPEASVRKLQTLDVEIAGLRAAHEAGLPSLRMDYAPDVTPSVRVAGEVLQDGEERAVADRATLELPGLGRLTLRSNRSEASGDELAAAERKRQALLAELRVADLAEALRRQADARVAAADLERLRQDLARLVPDGLPRLREDIARRRELAGGAGTHDPADLAADPDALRQSLAEAGLAVEAARNGAREAQPHLARAVDALVEAEKALAGLRSQVGDVESRLGPAEDRAAREAALAERLETARDASQEQDDRVATLRGRAPDLASVAAALERAHSAATGADREEARLRETLADLNGQIRTRADEAVEETWQETRDELAAAEARVRAYETDVAVLDRLRTALQASRSAARDLYLDPVLAELKPLLGLLFDEVSITFDEKTLLPQSLRRNGQDEEVDRLSGGMREQLSVLTRLAFARLLARDGRTAPVILDDALVYSDDDRIERMFDALHRQSRSQQIIVFSCRQRAFARLGGTVLELAPWEPMRA